MPPDYTLRPPAAGRRADPGARAARQLARDALLGNRSSRALPTTKACKAPANPPVLSKAGATNVDRATRSRNGETTQLVDKGQELYRRADFLAQAGTARPGGDAGRKSSA